jgi:hypothetical protein
VNGAANICSRGVFGIVNLPFSRFITPGWAQPRRLNLESVSELSIYVGGERGTGTLFFDSFKAYP